MFVLYVLFICFVCHVEIFQAMVHPMALLVPIGKPLMNRDEPGWFAMFRIMMQELLNIE